MYKKLCTEKHKYFWEKQSNIKKKWIPCMWIGNAILLRWNYTKYHVWNQHIWKILGDYYLEFDNLKNVEMQRT